MLLNSLFTKEVGSEIPPKRKKGAKTSNNRMKLSQSGNGAWFKARTVM